MKYLEFQTEHRVIVSHQYYEKIIRHQHIILLNPQHATLYPSLPSTTTHLTVNPATHLTPSQHTTHTHPSFHNTPQRHTITPSHNTPYVPSPPDLYIPHHAASQSTLHHRTATRSSHQHTITEHHTFIIMSLYRGAPRLHNRPPPLP